MNYSDQQVITDIADGLSDDSLDAIEKAIQDRRKAVSALYYEVYYAGNGDADWRGLGSQRSVEKAASPHDAVVQAASYSEHVRPSTYYIAVGYNPRYSRVTLGDRDRAKTVHLFRISPVEDGKAQCDFVAKTGFQGRYVVTEVGLND